MKINITFKDGSKATVEGHSDEAVAGAEGLLFPPEIDSQVYDRLEERLAGMFDPPLVGSESRFLTTSQMEEMRDQIKAHHVIHPADPIHEALGVIRRIANPRGREMVTFIEACEKLETMVKVLRDDLAAAEEAVAGAIRAEEKRAESFDHNVSIARAWYTNEMWELYQKAKRKNDLATCADLIVEMGHTDVAEIAKLIEENQK